jgi:hypothetical protein
LTTIVVELQDRPMTRRLAAAAIALALTAGAGACSSTSSSGTSSSSKAQDVGPAGDIPDTQAFVAFTPSGGGYSISVPEGWARSAHGTQTTFTNHFNTVSIGTAAGPPPTPATVRATVVPALQRTAPGFTLGRVQTVPIPAGAAVVTSYHAESPADNVTGKRVALDLQRYDIAHAGTVATITLSAPHGSDNVDAWRTITRSFSWSA